MNREAIRVVDLFAGPGGLGEGFSASGPNGHHPHFKLVASVEMEPNAHETLTLRAFTREFPRKKLPSRHSAYLTGENSRKGGVSG